MPNIPALPCRGTSFECLEHLPFGGLIKLLWVDHLLVRHSLQLLDFEPTGYQVTDSSCWEQFIALIYTYSI